MVAREGPSRVQRLQHSARLRRQAPIVSISDFVSTAEGELLDSSILRSFSSVFFDEDFKPPAGNPTPDVRSLDNHICRRASL